MKIKSQHIYITVLFYLFGLQISLAQTSFQNLYGGTGNENGNSIEQTSDGGYIVFGQSQSFSSSLDLYLLKLDASGSEEWYQTYGSMNWEFGLSVRETSDGGYILCGSWNGPSNDSLVLIKTDQSGVIEWNSRFSGVMDRQVGQSVIETSDGGFAACGFTSAFPNEDVFIVKTNSLGVLEWKKEFGGPLRYVARTIQQTDDDGYFVFGSTTDTDSGNGINAFYLMRLDNVGDTLWTKVYGTSIRELGNDMHLNADGTVVMTGNQDVPGGNIRAIKADASGNLIWSEYYGDAGWDLGHSITETTDNGYIIGGRLDSTINGGTHDMYLIKTDVNGMVQWERSYPFQSMSNIYEVQQTTDGGYVAVGSSFNDILFDEDLAVLKVPANGYLELTENNFDQNVSVFPNPFNEYTSINVSDFKSPVDIFIYGLDGTLLLQEEKVEEILRIDARQVNKGMNLFSVVSEGKVVARGKIIMH